MHAKACNCSKRKNPSGTISLHHLSPPTPGQLQEALLAARAVWHCLHPCQCQFPLPHENVLSRRGLLVVCERSYSGRQRLCPTLQATGRCTPLRTPWRTSSRLRKASSFSNSSISSTAFWPPPPVCFLIQYEDTVVLSSSVQFGSQVKTEA
jgi:hypothetical protein